METALRLHKLRPASSKKAEEAGQGRTQVLSLQTMNNKMAELMRKREPILIKVAHSWSMMCASSMIVQRIGKHFSVFNRKAPFSPAFVNNGGTWNGYDCAVNMKDGTFGTGLLSSVIEVIEKEGFSIELEDLRGPAPYSVGNSWKWTGHELRPEQVECVTLMKEAGMGIVKLPTGVGKCFGRGTPILMYDGTIKNVENIEVGDWLMGDDSTPRQVKSTCAGVGPLYRVVPRKGDPYIVNDVHILALKYTNVPKSKFANQKVDLSVKDYLASSKYKKHCLKGYRVGVDFPEDTTQLPIPPYFLGIWLGDGNVKDTGISTPDPEILEYLQNLSKTTGLRLSERQARTNRCPTYAMAVDKITNPKGKNWLHNALREENLLWNKHIPHKYKTNTRDVRLQVLAGLLDTDGYYHSGMYEIVSKYPVLASDICFLARSLGFAAYNKKCQKTCTNTGAVGTYYRIVISGEVSEIPCLVKRKQAQPRKQIKDVLVTGITVEPIGEGEYFGFALTGNKRFLLGDFTVAHNTEVLLKYLQEMGLSAIITVPTEDLMRQTVNRAANSIAGPKVGMLGAGKTCDDDCSIVVATQKTLMNLLQGAGQSDFVEWAARFDILISDEVHKIVSTDSLTKTWKMVMSIPAYYRFGVSATPFEEKGTLAELYLRQAYGPVLYEKTMQETVDAGYVVGFDVMLIKPEYPDGFTLNPLEGQSWQEAHEEFIVNNYLRNQIIIDTAVELIKDAEHKVLVVAQRIPHNDMLYQALRAALEPYNHVYQLHGKTKRREFVLESYARAKKPCVLVASSIANDGLDIPDIASILVAHGGKSFFQVIQRVGRGLRLAQDKERLILVDFDDSALGKWFKNHAQERKRLYKSLGGVIHYVA